MGNPCTYRWKKTDGITGCTEENMQEKDGYFVWTDGPGKDKVIRIIYDADKINYNKSESIVINEKKQNVFERLWNYICGYVHYMFYECLSGDRFGLILLSLVMLWFIGGLIIALFALIRFILSGLISPVIYGKKYMNKDTKFLRILRRIFPEQKLQEKQKEV